MSSIYKILITGPESTGKSSLCKKLAEYFNTVWVKEYAREYLELNGSEYQQSDLVEILKGQLNKEAEGVEKASRILFCDTGPEVISIWSNYKYGNEAPFITRTVKEHSYDLVLLLNVDLPWEPDPLREIPSLEERLKVLELFKNKLNQTEANWFLISGEGEDRFKQALEKLEQLLDS